MGLADGPTMRVVTLSLALAAGASIALDSAPSAACGACLSYEYDVHIIPYAARSLPLNPRVFAYLADPTGLTWTRVKDGASIPIDVTPAGGAPDAFWIAPRDLLEPKVDYAVGAVGDLEIFTTGQTSDVMPLRTGAVTIRPGGDSFGG